MFLKNNFLFELLVHHGHGYPELSQPVHVTWSLRRAISCSHLWVLVRETEPRPVSLIPAPRLRASRTQAGLLGTAQPQPSLSYHRTEAEYYQVIRWAKFLPELYQGSSSKMSFYYNFTTIRFTCSWGFWPQEKTSFSFSLISDFW